ncbi:MAG: ATP-dependent proteinase, Serine peptidase family, partial [Proteobacteria bacterium]|nr:ATP-dependent proteinase, Serine peptidase family [Pseudomonadota bacterium]
VLERALERKPEALPELADANSGTPASAEAAAATTLLTH